MPYIQLYTFIKVILIAIPSDLSVSNFLKKQAENIPEKSLCIEICKPLIRDNQHPCLVIEETMPGVRKRLKRRGARSAIAQKRKCMYRYACKRLGIIPRSHFIKQLNGAQINMRNENLDRKEINAICTTLVVRYGHLLK